MTEWTKDYVVHNNFPRLVCDEAHDHDVRMLLHNNGFCLACAEIYRAVCAVLTKDL